MKNPFRFDYLSPLDIETCRSRLTQAYKAELIKSGQYNENRFFGFTTLIYKGRKEQIIIDSSFSLNFVFGLSLEEHGKSTVLHCRHRLILSSVLFFPVLIALFSFSGLLASVFLSLTSQDPSYGAGAASALLFFVFSLFVCMLLWNYSRNTLDNLLHHLVQAGLLNPSKKKSP